MSFTDNFFGTSFSFDGTLLSPLDIMDESPTYPNLLGGDFTLYSDGNDPEEHFSLQSSPEVSQGIQNTPAESPDSPWSHEEDAIGSPILSPLTSGHLEEQGSLRPTEDLNALAARRLREDDGGKRRRKLSAATPAKRSRVEKKTAPEPKSRIRRPRKASFFCGWEGCKASFTRQREFEMHMGKHEKPLFFCDICQQLLTRKDNRKKHDESKRHNDNLLAHQANPANSPLLPPAANTTATTTTNTNTNTITANITTTTANITAATTSAASPFSSSPLSPFGSLESYPSPTSSPTVSTSSSPPYLEDTPLFLSHYSIYPDLLNQPIITDLSSFDTEAKMLMLHAKIAAIGKNAEALDVEIREVLQEMGTIRREA
ncbi:hypothetical protein AOL_s00173g302 [Orbilia oligospora ATCC 24927]|uniref:C2H2-type domain-containing protein n=1 Tax=Arthrobotrys oligospora (strain ATCC 24927 / CBS 115.81 / DSM 1491) TaxID=756982 RepID=G1XPD4_ARTOA|nr:hypothetical protein AOL_s00173g302 [Orbilia oligospora ATCC 24927]EGX45201.1 hypothetical protein AOL_s00173g302 [Orbilia oligospora ATCC 24927]